MDDLHQVIIRCDKCHLAVQIERISVSGEGTVELLGTCPSGDVVRVEKHFAELVAKSVLLDRKERRKVACELSA